MRGRVGVAGGREARGGEAHQPLSTLISIVEVSEIIGFGPISTTFNGLQNWVPK